MIQGITQWVWGWRKRGWKTAQGGDVLNRDLWEQLFDLVAARGRGTVDWRWVRGHVGTVGNERADQISVAFALQQDADLYDGPFDEYPLRILDDLPADTAVPKRSSGAAAGSVKAAAHWLISVVGGIPMRHGTWPECERRVKGQSGARYKKSTSAEDESAILRGWGNQSEPIVTVPSSAHRALEAAMKLPAMTQQIESHGGRCTRRCRRTIATPPSIARPIARRPEIAPARTACRDGDRHAPLLLLAGSRRISVGPKSSSCAGLRSPLEPSSGVAVGASDTGPSSRSGWSS